METDSEFNLNRTI